MTHSKTPTTALASLSRSDGSAFSTSTYRTKQRLRHGVSTACPLSTVPTSRWIHYQYTQQQGTRTGVSQYTHQHRTRTQRHGAIAAQDTVAWYTECIHHHDIHRPQSLQSTQSAQTSTISKSPCRRKRSRVLRCGRAGLRTDSTATSDSGCMKDEKKEYTGKILAAHVHHIAVPIHHMYMATY
jgi:hypothetical protein